ITGGIMPQMRKLALVLVITACTSSPSPPPAATHTAPPPEAPVVYGFTVDEEVRVLRMEDRREYDAALVDAWIHNANALLRARMALALGRVGPHTFDDANGN